MMITGKGKMMNEPTRNQRDEMRENFLSAALFLISRMYSILAYRTARTSVRGLHEGKQHVQMTVSMPDADVPIL